MRSHLLAFLAVLAGLLATCPSKADAQAIGLTALNPMQRIQQHQAPFGTASVEIFAARNEVESFQVVVAALQGELRVARAELTELIGDGDARFPADCFRLYRQEYVRVRQSTPRAEVPPGLYPDAFGSLIDPITGQPIEPRGQRRERWGEPLVTSGHDMYALPFEVFEGQNQPLWIDVRVPKETPAGAYRGVFRVTAREGRAEIPVTLTVWDFTLPDGPTHRNHFGSFTNITHFFNVTRGSERYREIEARYCRAIAEHRINPPIPSHLLPEVNPDGSLKIEPQQHAALQQFMAELNVTDFQIPRSPFGRLPHSTTGEDYKRIPPVSEKAVRYYRDYHQYLKANGWADRAYIYLLDEPNTPENYEQVRVLAEVVREASEELKCLVVEQTYPHDPSWPEIDGAVDIWCPLWAFIDRETIRQKLAAGDAVWSYTALVQRAPPYHPQYEQVRDKDPPYWHIDRPLLVYRVPTWINRQYGITGLLYWSTVTRVIEPWFNPAFAHPRHYNGGGYLFYPGVPCGIDGPITSMRLKNLRDGMEDYEYFALLEQRGGAAQVQEIVDRVTPTWWQYPRDPQTLLEVRRELAEAIMRGESSVESNPRPD